MALLGCTEHSTVTPTSPALSSSDASADRGESNGPSAAATLAWQKTARDLVASHNTAPFNAVRLYALHSLAQYAAVVAVGGGRNDESDDRGGWRAANEARRGAVAGASAQLLGFLIPDAVSGLEAQVLADGIRGTGQASAEFTRGVAAGRTAGDAMIRWARNDGFALAWNESMRSAPGVGIWEGARAVPPAARPAPAGYQFPTMTPYFLKALDGHTAQRQFRPVPPPAYSLSADSRFQADLAEVKTIFLNRQQWQTDIANFWNLPAGTPTALGHWDEQAALFVAEQHLDELAASHLFAVLNAATMDATIGCWEAKYFYLMLRPTMADPTITTVYPLPNHPSYPSGHSCVSSAAATVLATYFPGHAKQLRADVIEAGLSRIYGGIHYRFDIEAGQALGRSTAEWALAYDRERGLLSAVGLGSPDEVHGRH
jgi:membrane-associated phospholipid phosphatase